MRRIHHGTIYVAVLGMSLLVTVIAIGAITAVRANARARDRDSDTDDARYYALSGTELARLKISQNPAWRTDFQNGVWINSQPIGAGAFSVSVTNPNGTLNNSELDPVVITSTGTKGIATQLMSVTLVAKPTPLTCLGTACMAASNITINNATIRGTGRFSSGGTLNAKNSSFNGNPIEAIAVISTGNTGLGSQTILSSPRSMPATTVFDYYVQHGTAIDYNSVSGHKLDKLLLSPANNPYGATAPNGVYVIDCGGKTISVQNCRVFGTLVLLNTKSDSKIDQGVNFSPAVANFPTLLVQGSIQFTFGPAVLDEHAAGNLNPAGTPYGGSSNSTATDTYPSQIVGLTYVSGNATSTGGSNFTGCLVVAGTLNVTQALSVTWDGTNFNNPPPGFIVSPPPMIISPGTWAQVVR